MSEDLVKIYRCRRCKEGHVIPLKKEGRYYTYRQIKILVPSDVYIPSCTHCGMEWLTDLDIVALDVILEQEYEPHADMINKRIVIRDLGYEPVTN